MSELITQNIDVNDIPVTYNITDDAIAEMREAYSELSAETPQGYQEVKTALRKVVTTRTTVEKTRKALNEDAIAWKRRVDSEAKRITAMLLEVELPLKEKRDAVDQAKEIERERKRKEKEEAERAKLEAEMKAKRDAEEAERKAREAEEAKKRAEEEKRLAAERAQLEKERAELEERRKAERAEQEKREAELRKQQEEERARLEAERQKELEERRKVQAELERQQAQLRAEQERIAKEKAEAQAEQERVEAEKRKAAEIANAAARAAALAPDREKIKAYIDQLIAIEPPAVSSDEALNVLAYIMDQAARTYAEAIARMA